MVGSDALGTVQAMSARAWARRAERLAQRHGGFQGTRHAEGGHLRGQGHFEGELPLRSDGLAAGGVFLQGAVFEDPAGQSRVDGLFDPLIEQRGNLRASSPHDSASIVRNSQANRLTRSADNPRVDRDAEWAWAGPLYAT
jgi:hypothetical protein